MDDFGPGQKEELHEHQVDVGDIMSVLRGDGNGGGKANVTIRT